MIPPIGLRVKPLDVGVLAGWRTMGAGAKFCSEWWGVKKPTTRSTTRNNPTLKNPYIMGATWISSNLSERAIVRNEYPRHTA
jgi:hypothetical protein